MLTLVRLPALLWAAGLAVIGTYGWIGRAEAADAVRATERTEASRQQSEAERLQADDARRTLSLQLVGAQLITPYIARGLPLQAQLPAILHGNPHKRPKAYYAPASGGPGNLKYMLGSYIAKVIDPFETPFWVQRPKGRDPGTSFFYTGLKWTTFKGDARVPETENQIPIFMTLPTAVQPPLEPPTLGADERMLAPIHLPPDGNDYSKQYRAMLARFSPLEEIDFDLVSKLYNKIGNRKEGHHPIHYRFGGAATGFTSLAAAFEYLEAHPTEVIWLMAVDAPGYGPEGKDEQPDEAAVLLLLAHRDFDTGREPLAMIHRPVHATAEQGKRPVERLKFALKEAVERGGVAPAQVGRYFHDATGGKALGLAAQAATESLPDFVWDKQQFGLPGWLGEMGATTTPYQLLLAAWAANTEGKPALVVSVAGSDAMDAVLVVPPKHYTPTDTKQPYWRARSENDYSRPWWGRRKDGEPDVGMVPMNKDDGTPADVAPVYELKYE